jgi:hypothetical protein
MGENADAIDFGSWLFLAAMVIFVLTMIIGLIAQTAGTLTLLTPTALHDKYLGLSEDEFKKNALLYAGQHSEKNHRTVLRKGMAMSAMTGLFILEAVLLVIWVASG